MVTLLLIGTSRTNISEIWIKAEQVCFEKFCWKRCLQNVAPFLKASTCSLSIDISIIQYISVDAIMFCLRHCHIWWVHYTFDTHISHDIKGCYVQCVMSLWDVITHFLPNLKINISLHYGDSCPFIQAWSSELFHILTMYCTTLYPWLIPEPNEVIIAFFNFSTVCSIDTDWISSPVSW